MVRRPTAIDLYAGAGGATQGLKDAGFRVLAAVENDPDAAASYYANHPEVVPLFFDIRDAPIRELRLALGLERGEVSLIKACPPCQGFSTLGSRRRDDPINDLVGEVWDWVREFRPLACLLENVVGLGTDARFHGLVRRLRAVGYGVRLYEVDAADFGVPQRRRRLIALGVRGRRAADLPGQLADALPATFDVSPRTAGEAIAVAGPIDETTDPVHRARRPKPHVLERLRAIPPGGGRFDLPRKLRLACHENMTARNATAPYGRIRVDEPAPTLTTRCTTPSCGRFVHPTEHRGISLREAALLQTFPPDYEFRGSYGSIERQIGNAVPVKLAHAIGLAAMRQTRGASAARFIRY